MDLPASMTIHNTFHISLLEPYEDNKFPSQIQTPAPPIEIDGEPEYELGNIIDSCRHRVKLLYHAKWTGYSPEHDQTWYQAVNFKTANIAIEHFHSRYSRKPGLGTRTITRSISEPPPSKGRKNQHRRQLRPKTDRTTTGSFCTTLPTLARHTRGQWRPRNSAGQRKLRCTRGCPRQHVMTTSARCT